MTYQSLYRKYRPQTFDDVIGQENIVSALTNAVLRKKISHAYLLTGPRGTGKTTSAKLLAKAINCESLTETICGVCANCELSSNNAHPDIVEIDAASNNGVDEIRSLIERVKFTPIVGKYKVYIIDEIHMLTPGAFNALLKTLEEPPSHVVFILATTEIHKVLPTIISRCQRFDFARISEKDITDRLELIVKKEHRTIQENAAALIASLSGGGMRNALTILEQAMILNEGNITVQSIYDNNGMVLPEEKISLFDNLKNKDISKLINTISTVMDKTVDVSRFVMELIAGLKDSIIYSYTKNDAYINVNDKALAEYLDLSYTNKEIVDMINILLDYHEKIRFSSTPAVHFEIALIELYERTEKPENYVPYLQETQVETEVETQRTDEYIHNEDNNGVNKVKDIQPVQTQEYIERPDVTPTAVEIHRHEEKPVENTIHRDLTDIIEEYEATTPAEIEIPSQVLENPNPQEIKEADQIIGKPQYNYNEEDEFFDEDEPLDDAFFTAPIPKVESVTITETIQEVEPEAIIETPAIMDSQQQATMETQARPSTMPNMNQVNNVERETQTPIIEDAVQSSIFETPITAPIEEKVEIETPKQLISIQKLDLTIEEIVQYMVSADKNLRITDTDSFSHLKDYLSNPRWAKESNLLNNSNISLSGESFILVVTKNQAQSRAILDEINLYDLISFTTEILGTPKQVFAATENQFKIAIESFKDLSSKKQLPDALSASDFITGKEDYVDETEQILMDMFGSKLEIK